MGGDLSVWLDGLLAGRTAPRATARVIEILRSDPQKAAFATVRSMAETAGVNMATVTRTGQFLGYSGWPAFVVDYRGQYLSTLRAGTIPSRGGVADVSPGPRARVHQDAEVLQSMAENLDQESFHRAAQQLRRSGRIVVLATGMYLAPAIQLSYNCQLLGCDSEVPMASASMQLNAVRRLGPGDTLVIFTIWKTADVVFRLTRYAHSRGVPVMAFADRSTPASAMADFTLTVPTEGTSYLPSGVPVVSAVQALLGTLADIDPRGAEASFAEADALWAEMGIIHDM
ncbi:MurR/RpiR family transcriptional regulator [Nesterenkonia suensis]